MRKTAIEVSVADQVAAMHRLEVLRQRLFYAIGRELAFDGHCKSTEGRFAVHFPDYHEVNSGHPEWMISLYCYVVGPNRSYDWTGRTLMEAVAAAEDDVGAWIAEADEYFTSGEGKDDLPAGWSAATPSPTESAVESESEETMRKTAVREGGR